MSPVQSSPYCALSNGQPVGPSFRRVYITPLTIAGWPRCQRSVIRCILHALKCADKNFLCTCSSNACLPVLLRKDKVHAHGLPRAAQIVPIHSGPQEKCCCGLEICLILPGDLLQQRERVGSPPITQVALGRHALGDPPAERISVDSIHVQQSPRTCSPVSFLHRNPMNLQQAS